jgi:hypothetical protein
LLEMGAGRLIFYENKVSFQDPERWKNRDTTDLVDKELST